MKDPGVIQKIEDALARVRAQRQVHAVVAEPRGACYIEVGDAGSCSEQMTRRECEAAAQQLGGRATFVPNQSCQ